jgi:hypothetical protein
MWIEGVLSLVLEGQEHVEHVVAYWSSTQAKVKRYYCLTQQE